jgi:putative acetyltransferase
MIRSYIKSDDYKIIDIWLKASLVSQSFLGASFIEEEAKNIKTNYLPKALTWVKEIDGETVGFISMLGNQIGGLFVHPYYQSKGVGTELIQYVQQNNQILTVEVFEKNLIGRSFYRKMGFTYLNSYNHYTTNEPIIRLMLKKV